MTQVLITISIIVYLAVVVAIGIFYSKKNKNTDDFYLGGRKLGPLVTAMSAEASETAIGLAIGTYINWLIVAKRIRRYSQAYGAFTLPDFFSKRFGGSKTITFISALMIVIFFIPYTASGFAACGKLFSSLFGIDYFAAMAVSAAIIVIYCAMGGFLAASTTDFIQSIVMTIALVVVVVFGVNVAGGLDVVIDNAKQLPGYLDLFHTYSSAANTAQNYSILSICSMLAWGLGYFGMPHILLRFMAIEDENKLKLSRRVASVWVIISLAVAVFIGIVGYSMSKAGAIEMLTGSDSETIIVRIANLLSTYNPLAAIIAGVILAGILAATMSTADSQLLASASSVSQNLMKECFNIKMSEKSSLIAARVTVVVISILGVILASNPDSSVFEIVSFAWAGFGATFGPIVLLSLFWKRANKYGAIAGMISGGAMIFIWKYGIAQLGGIFAIYELLPAFIVAVVVNVVVSLLTKAPDKEVVEKFESIK